MSEGLETRRFSFGLRSLLSLVMVIAIVTYFVTAASSIVAVFGLFVVSAVIPSMLAIAALYDREDRRAFYIGAMFPAASFFIGLVVYCVQFIELLPIRGAAWTNFLSRFSRQFQSWSVVCWALSAIVGLVAVGAQRLIWPERKCQD